MYLLSCNGNTKIEIIRLETTQQHHVHSIMSIPAVLSPSLIVVDEGVIVVIVCRY